MIDQMFSGVPEDERQKMLRDNAIKFFRLS
jgi:hypothetical protein